MCRRRTNSVCLEDSKEQLSMRDEDDDSDNDIENLLFYSEKKIKTKKRINSLSQRELLSTEDSINQNDNSS